MCVCVCVCACAANDGEVDRQMSTQADNSSLSRTNSSSSDRGQYVSVTKVSSIGPSDGGQVSWSE